MYSDIEAILAIDEAAIVEITLSHHMKLESFSRELRIGVQAGRVVFLLFFIFFLEKEVRFKFQR